MTKRKTSCAVATGSLTLAVAFAALASSHREAPFITKLPKVDSTDMYTFRSYENGREGYVTLIANYDPFQERFAGPNYYTMDPEALYEIHVDNTGDGIEDLTFQFRFKNDLAGAALDIGQGAAKKSVPVPLINVGPIKADDMSKQNVLESYTIKVIRGDRRTGQKADVTNTTGGTTTFKKPLDYIGTKTFGDAAAYEAYARAHLYSINIPGCTGQGRVFVGQRKEGFAVNVGPIFDLVNAPASAVTQESARNAVPNPLDKNNVTSIALEVPISCLKGNSDIIGVWQTASVRQARVLNPQATYDKPSREGGAWTQVSRLGMPLVNEIVIGLRDKDRFNSSHPKGDAQFLDYVTNPTLPAIIESLFGPAVKAPTKIPRDDLVTVFLKGVPNVNANGSTCEYQRLNTALPPTPKGSQNNLGAAQCFVNGALKLENQGCDPAGFPNGRRPGDDVVDIELRVAMGYLLTNDADAPSRNVPFGDGVLQDASQFDEVFPYLRTPNPGANGDGT